MSDTERDPWERQKGESRQAFAAFCIYRDQGTKRSIRRAAVEALKSRPLLARWSMRWDWVNRTDAWDALKDLESREAQLDAVRAMNKRHAEAGIGLLSVGAQRLRHIQKHVEEKDAMFPSDAVRMIVEGASLERRAVGLPTQIVGGVRPAEERPDDWADMTDEQLRTLLAREPQGGEGEPAPGSAPAA